jgi:aryl-alcohol dehydrogenase-like predicted oxidoreductase
MEYVHLGRSGLSVSRLCLGTMNLDDAQRAVTLSLGDEVLKRLDELFPGYRPAPEHYAW